MGIDITTYAGVGIHLSSEIVEKWAQAVGEHPQVALDQYVYGPSGKNLLYYTWVANYWLGDDHGYIIWVNRLTRNQDSDEAEAGVYRAVSVEALTDVERELLDWFGKEITGKDSTYPEFLLATVVY